MVSLYTEMLGFIKHILIAILLVIFATWMDEVDFLNLRNVNQVGEWPLTSLFN